ncbi:hypothetical protein Godav_024686 [Gossypium davidsonii]|uniref:Protein kinase domain-containing protein n=1 Tax=Gossypium davidsonii TaxID=34287 RepID=A0A7J8TH44_GOSDV|nr:hypothetical protein [Gossypium davidsonii]
MLNLDPKQRLTTQEVLVSTFKTSKSCFLKDT